MAHEHKLSQTHPSYQYMAGLFLISRCNPFACCVADHLSPANEFVCDWVRGPFVLGLAELLKRPDPTGVLNQTWTHAYLTRWADHFEVSAYVCLPLGISLPRCVPELSSRFN